MKVCRRVWRTSKKFILYLRRTCLAVNKSMFSTPFSLKYLQSLLAITAGIQTFATISADFMKNLLYLYCLLHHSKIHSTQFCLLSLLEGLNYTAQNKLGIRIR